MDSQLTQANVERSDLEAVLATGEYEARTLPSVCYTSQAVFDWERRHFFEKSWICLGKTDDLTDPGAQKAVSMIGQSLLLVRGKDHVLRGFFNTCRHRGHELLGVGVCTNRKTIACPYHNWTYLLDGHLNGAPTMRGEPGFDQEAFGLNEFAVREWAGSVFANLTGDGMPFEDQLGNMVDIPDAYEPERTRLAGAHTYAAQANWKLIFENYMECYHCTSIHPALCAVSDVGSEGGWEHHGLWAGGPMDLLEHAQTMSLTGESFGVNFRNLSVEDSRRVIYLSVIPNLLLSLHPDYIMTHLLDPVAPDVTNVTCSFYFAPESYEHPGFTPSYALDFWDVTNREDLGACEGVQRGMASLGYRSGPFAEMEGEVLDVQRIFARGYLSGGLSPVGTLA